MLKKTIKIGLLGFGMMMLLQTQAIAWGTSGGGWGRGSYYAFYDIHGGQRPGTNTTYVGTNAFIIQASLVCKNPGGERDVRGGKGGITIQILSDLANAKQMDDRGRFTLTTDPICSQDGETITITNFDQTITTHLCDQVDLKDLYDVDTTDCRNANWFPFDYLVQKLNVSGTIYTNCTGVDSEGFPTGCDSTPPLTLYCETNADTRTPWTAENVRYVCVDAGGSPVAHDDNYSVRKDRTLKVSAPGVLGNDTDPEGDPITAITYSGPSEKGGIVGLNTNGSFSYTPAAGFTGVDSFKYKALDKWGNTSNEANVIITVY